MATPPPSQSQDLPPATNPSTSEPNTNYPFPKINIPSPTLQNFTESILIANGVSPSNATIIANALVLADLRGVDTHGVNRIPSYMERIRRGVLDPKAEPVLTQITPVVAGIDGRNGFGFLAARRGMEACITMAHTYGIGLCTIKHSNHFGMSAWVVQQALSAGMLSLVFTNSSPAMPAFGSKEKLLGVSPIACGAPGPLTGPYAGKDFILDMAPSTAARGKIHKALRRNETIPLDWALDKHGNPTTDPAAALEGVMLPMGGPKGSALAIMMDVFSGVLSGSAFAGNVTGPYDLGGGKEADVGHFLIAIKPDLFLSAEDFRERVGTLYGRVVGSEKRDGVDRIWFPGEIEMGVAEERRRMGIPFVRGEVEALNGEAERVGVEKLEVILSEGLR